MSLGVQVFSLKSKIIKPKDDLCKIIINTLTENINQGHFELKNDDIVAITEGVVAIANENIVSLDEVVESLKTVMPGNDICIVFPILSRNRFSLILKAIAKAYTKVSILFSFPKDEVGNPLILPSDLKEIKVNYQIDAFDLDYYNSLGDFKHPFTHVNIIRYYENILVTENCQYNFIFSNNPLHAIKCSKNILICSTHNRFIVQNNFKEYNVKTWLLTDICANRNKVNNNPTYGLLGSNKMADDKLKLFPYNAHTLLTNLQSEVKKLYNVHIEALIFGDGAFMDPLYQIWELADPVVSPFYTSGLQGSPNEIKIKYFSSIYPDLNDEKLLEIIKEQNLENTLGTTPRRYVDLIGSLCDLVVGSGERKTPFVLIKNYIGVKNNV